MKGGGGIGLNEISNFILYTTPNGDVQLDILLQNENLWLTQKGLAELFGVERSVITKHLKNIYDSGELDKVSTCAKFAQVQQEGNRTVRRELEYYNLDAIISVGYRVNSSKATQFRIWATKTLKEFIIKGFILDDERLKQGQTVFDIYNFEFFIEEDWQFKVIDIENFEFFIEEDWQFKVIDIEDQECYCPNSVESLQASLYPLFDYLLENIILTKFLTNEAKKFRRKPVFSNHSSMIKTLSEVNDWYSFMSEEKMKGIRMDLVHIFVENGIRRSTDFKKWTEKEVLALKGIGPATVQKLKENGIQFKNEK